MHDDRWLSTPDPKKMDEASMLPPPPYSGTFGWNVKLVLDRVISASLFALLSPLIVLLGILIRLDSDGPVFFRQERVTQRGRRFLCLKFRTMRDRADTLPHLKFLDLLIAGHHPDHAAPDGTDVFKLVDDRRVTRVGRHLRRLSLDELPQLWNVIQGDLSLVGPQAPQAFEVERYRPEWLRRLAVPAGLTGPWQVDGRGRVSYEKMICMDLHYVDHWSLKYDLALLSRTAKAVLSGRGAH